MCNVHFPMWPQSFPKDCDLNILESTQPNDASTQWLWKRSPKCTMFTVRWTEGQINTKQKVIRKSHFSSSELKTEDLLCIYFLKLLWNNYPYTCNISFIPIPKLFGVYKYIWREVVLHLHGCTVPIFLTEKQPIFSKFTYLAKLSDIQLTICVGKFIFHINET